MVSQSAIGRSRLAAASGEIAAPTTFSVSAWGNVFAAGFAGNCIYPSSVFAADLLVSFSTVVTAFSIHKATYLQPDKHASAEK